MSIEKTKQNKIESALSKRRQRMKRYQKYFSPLECGLCGETNCLYKSCYESMYNTGKRIAVANCKRLQEQKRKEKYRL